MPCDAFYATVSGIFGGGTFGRYEANGTLTTIATIPGGLNGAGYNVVDGFVYAFSGSTMYRFHDDGTVDNLGTFGLPGGLVIAGFDDAGNFYAKEGGSAIVYVIDVTNNTFTTQIPNANFAASDWAWHPGFQTFYGVEGSTLYSFNPASNTVTTAPLDGVPGGEGTFGGTLYGANGFIYAAANGSGSIYKINVETLEGQFIITTFNAAGLDGASCSGAMPPWAFICAEDDEACAAEGATTEIPVLDNDIATNTTLNNFTFLVILPPANGTVNFNAATGQAEYTPNGFPQVDQFTYRICGNSVPITCDQATVNIIPGSPITFPDFGPYCQGDFAPPLPNSSLEGVSGNWFPPAISTGFPGTIEYTFYPDPSTDPTVCYGEQVVEIEVIETLVPEFNIPDQFCQGDVVPSLPTLSDNFVSGTWDPSTINNQITRTYTFTPDAFFCADEIDLTITITPQDEPMFSFETQYCTGGTVDALP
ncbi:MAG: Ig-like domain-containing protein, partial [Bacteroidota bacterium]